MIRGASRFILPAAVHVAGEPAFSFNKWSDPSSDMDIGIDRSQGEHPDWTFARNAGTFARRRLEVYVR